ncbi:Reverse transcriptase domain [Arabidopsis thaliana x Arabidopsis arenosa]|uniref:Reverse transcriptase domain n=1 Tax=Arabidopsis thaliana x Arabidopsis arenosa TaxID=1240361 RepID=A0A8T1YCF2_9BRAS|nr:Reverse transcriptase domain [Arabidopsis thaliana x Arabidopsis arenosa]
MTSFLRTDRMLIPQIQHDLAIAYRDEEVYWKLKSRNTWMIEGDRNTQFFHACAKSRFSQNYIVSIKDETGVIHRGFSAIGDHAEHFFTNVYKSTNHQVSTMDFADFIPSVTSDINDDLTKEFTSKEIYEAVSQIGDDRAPGPDGLTARFYKQCWDIVGEDVIAEVKTFFHTSVMKPAINHTNICMIPKINDPITLSDYRPIGLCNVLYKIISKCLVMRLKKHLDSIVSDSQAAFIPGRLITDSVMIAHEIMHSLKARKRVSQTYMAVKTDVSKAYDRVEWNFLETTMRLFGFSEKWIGWIMATIRTVHYSVLINGSPYGSIVPERGIRQGDPLSPYLFILCADVLSHLIKSKARDGDIRGVRIGNGVPAITHLQFADDSLFFYQANRRNCIALKEAFEVYEYYSGQKINTSKSMITFGSRVFGHKQNDLKQILAIPNHGGGGKYLGLPEQFGRKKREMFDNIIDRVKKRTTSWSVKYLSPAGKEIMIKSVALAMPVYSMSCFKLPKGVIDEIESLLMRFWWEKSSQHKGISWIAWERLQYSKSEGGLGFRNLAKFNDALLAKLAWRIIRHPNTLFARLMKARYFKDESILNAKPRQRQSYGWSSILHGLDIIKKGTRFQVGDGNSINVMRDNIVPDHPPRPLSLVSPNPELYISDLITHMGDYCYWNPNKLDHIVAVDHAVLHQTHLPRVISPDKLIWHYDKTGEYTVRSGYWFATHDPTQEVLRLPPPHGSLPLKKPYGNYPLYQKLNISSGVF